VKNIVLFKIFTFSDFEFYNFKINIREDTYTRKYITMKTTV